MKSAASATVPVLVCTLAIFLLSAMDAGMKSLVVAVGVYNMGTEDGVTDYNMIYALAAKTFGPVRVTAGYCRGNEDALGTDEDMLLLGLDGCLTKDKKWWGAVDYQSGENAFGAFSVGVSYAVAPNVNLLVGYDFYNADGVDDTYTTQLDINF